MSLKLIAAKDGDFAWMLGQGGGRWGLRLSPGGLGDAAMIAMLRREAQGLRRQGYNGYWLAAAGGEIVGLCGYKRLPDAHGSVDFGYGIADSRQRRGYGTSLVAALIKQACRNPAITTLIAETALDNIASHTVLERNGFRREGHRLDHDDGPLMIWQRDVRRVHPALWPKKSPHRKADAGMASSGE